MTESHIKGWQPALRIPTDRGVQGPRYVIVVAAGQGTQPDLIS